MAVTEEDLKDFNRFATEKLANGGAESVTQLAAAWEERRQVNAAIRAGLADIEAGRTRSFAESQEEFRKKNNLPPHS